MPHVIRLLFAISSFASFAQNIYVGQALYDSQFQPVLIEARVDSIFISFPDMDYKEKFGYNVRSSTSIYIHQNPLHIKSFSKGTINAQLHIKINGIEQHLELHEVDTTFAKEDFSLYSGGFRDKANYNSLIYAGSRSLRFTSPYTKKTRSLKKLQNGKFWSPSGELLEFSQLQNGKYTQLHLSLFSEQKKQLAHFVPFTIQEHFIPVGNDTLYAKLFLPQTNEPVPGCLVLQGGGQAGLANYEYEAKHFAVNGIAAMVFNKSGDGKSTGVGNFALQSFEEKTKQYLAVYDYFLNREEIDASRTGIHGPSEGGRLALMMAIDQPEKVNFVISTAAPLMNMMEGQLFAIANFHRNALWPEEDILKSRTIWNNYYQGIIAGAIDPQTIEEANRLRGKYQPAFLPPNSTAIPSAPRADDLLNDRVVEEAMAITCPIFFQYGSNDERVNAPKSLDNFRRVYDNTFDLKFYPESSHSFQTPAYQISTGYMQDKINWLKKIGILD